MTQSSALPLTIRGATKVYGRARALDQVDLDIRAGEFLTLLGPSGSGKTTLLMILAGFIRPDSGNIKFGEREMAMTPPHRRGIGMVFQNYALFPHMNVAANIGYPLKLRGIGGGDAEKRVENALATVRLQGFGARRVNQLSGGQKQRVALARAIVFEPRILLMDEPLSALDKKLREQMQTELRQLHEQLGMTTVYVTHDQREALTMSDRIAVINDGKLIQLGAPREIYDHPVNAFVADFIGESTLLPVKVQDGEVRRNDALVKISGAPPAEGNYFLLLRPERLALVEDAEPAVDDNFFPGTVREISYQGESVLLHVMLDDGAAVFVRIAGDKKIPDSGARATLRLRQEHAALVTRDLS